jgi:hypothetical protein
MWSNKDIPFNHHFSVVCRSSWSGVKVRDNGGSDSDCAIVPDRYVFGMYLVNIDKLANPNIAPDRYAAQSLKGGPQTVPARGHKSDLGQDPTQNKWQIHRLRPRFLGNRNY